MDEAKNTDREEKGAEGNLGGILDSMLKNPELIQKISGVLSGLNNQENPPADSRAAESGDDVEIPASSPDTDELSKKLSALLENKELMAALPGILSGLRPPGPAGHGGHHHGHHGHHHKPGADKKIALMCALKPYLSGRRREMIDYLIKVNKLSDIFHSLT